MLLLEGMSHMEGYGVPEASGAPDRPTANNNPLDLIWGAEAKAFGAIRGDRTAPGGLDGYSGMAVFPDVATGWKAAQRWLSVPAKFEPGPVTGFPFCDPTTNETLVGGYLGATLAQLVYRFAPPNENNTEHYLDYLEEETGILRTTTVTAEMLTVPNMTPPVDIPVSDIDAAANAAGVD
jgi:hypothetical protein